MSVGMFGNRIDGPEPSTISSTLLQASACIASPRLWRRLVKLFLWPMRVWLVPPAGCERVRRCRCRAGCVYGPWRLTSIASTAIRPGDSFGGWLRTITRNLRHGSSPPRRHKQTSADGGTSAYERLLGVAETPESAEAFPSSHSKGLLSRRMLDLVRGEFESRTLGSLRPCRLGRPIGGRRGHVAMGMNVAAVYQAKSRVLRRLRQELKGFEPG